MRIFAVLESARGGVCKERGGGLRDVLLYVCGRFEWQTCYVLSATLLLLCALVYDRRGGGGGGTGVLDWVVEIQSKLLRRLARNRGGK